MVGDASCTCGAITAADPSRHFKECPARGKFPLAMSGPEAYERGAADMRARVAARLDEDGLPLTADEVRALPLTALSDGPYNHVQRKGTSLESPRSIRETCDHCGAPAGKTCALWNEGLELGKRPL